MKLIFATNNAHKLQEARAILGDKIELVSLSDIGCTDDIPETADTLDGNAHLKAQYILDKFGMNCFADDTGLEVEFLNGAPGVYSARYAGESHDFAANRIKLLQDMRGAVNRKAHFRTVIVLLLDGKEYRFEGIVNGTIIEEERGENGFGYDSIFIQDGHSQTFAELDATIKNQISHRAHAMQKLVDFLKSKNY